MLSEDSASTLSDATPGNIILSQSAPTFALLSEKGESVDIDINTGLPKLPVELPPLESYLGSLSERQGRAVYFQSDLENASDMSNKSPTTSSTRPTPSTYSPLIHKKISGTQSGIEASQSVEENPTPPIKRGNRSRHTLPLKNRSRSVFIRLQLPNARTPPLPHRNLSILGESDSSDTDIQTAPVVETQNKPFFNYEESRRRASDGHTLEDKKKKMNLTELNSGTNQEDSAQILTDSPNPVWYNKSVGRRGSYLYMSDTDEDEPVVTRSRASSMSSHIGDETYVTPFAQILANLRRVRSQLLSLLSLPADTRTTYSRPHSMTSPITGTPPKRLSEAAQKRLAMQTLEEFDWCVKKLESVSSASMGTMAQDKFRRMLTRELSHMSGKSKSGNRVSEWVQNITDLDMGSSVVDRALDTSTAMQQQEEDEERSDKLYLQEARLSGSLSHDVWSKMKKRVGKSTHSTSGYCPENADYCVRVPMFGVYDPKMNKPAMKEFMIKHLDEWDVDTFHLDTISADNSLISASYMVFKKRDLFSTFKISPPLFINFISKIQSAYFPNPYHNKVHAADVLLATNYLLKAEALKGVFTDLEILAALTAAAIHDVGHPARTNQFLVNVQHELALLYNDNSVLENHHLSVAFKTLQDPKCNFLENFDRDQRQAFRRMVIDMVLATDMAKHFKHLGELKTLLETQKVANDGILVLDKYSDRSEVLQIMIHCADLSNPTKREDLAADWSRRIMEENFLQGDEEKSLGIPLNPLGDREQVSLYKCQVTFIDFIVYPLWETWAELVYPAGQLMLDNIAKTREYWSTQIDPNSPSNSDPESEQGGCKEAMTNQIQNCISNGQAQHCTDGRVNERVECDDSPGKVGCCGLMSASSEERSSLSEDSIRKRFAESPVSERRQSFKTMKNLKALEGSMS